MEWKNFKTKTSPPEPRIAPSSVIHCDQCTMQISTSKLSQRYVSVDLWNKSSHESTKNWR